MSAGALMEDEPQIHKSTAERLVYMANQIATAFTAQVGKGGEGQAVSATADHLKSFWSRNMLRDIFAHIETAGSDSLKPIALKALLHLRERSPQALQREVEAAGMHSGREQGDDAG